jgi:hypothetical protein
MSSLARRRLVDGRHGSTEEYEILAPASRSLLEEEAT